MEIRGVERLTYRERQVVVLKELGWTAEAIARRLGLAPSSVATLFARAKGKGYEVVVVLEGDPLALGDLGETDQDSSGEVER